MIIFVRGSFSFVCQKAAVAELEKNTKKWQFQASDYQPCHLLLINCSFTSPTAPISSFT